LEPFLFLDLLKIRLTGHEFLSNIGQSKHG
jgi:hypothetical protein